MKRQFGTLRRLPSGRWQARYRNPHTGERHGAPITFERKSVGSLRPRTGLRAMRSASTAAFIRVVKVVTLRLTVGGA